MSSRASETVLWIVDLLLSPLFREAIVRVGSLGEIFATHFPVKILLMLIDPMGETEKNSKFNPFSKGVVSREYKFEWNLAIPSPDSLSTQSVACFETLQYEIIKSWSAVMYILFVLQLGCHNS